MRTKNRAPYFNTEATVDVEIDPDDLHDAGWHHEDECKLPPHELAGPLSPLVSLADAVASLHRQAHPSQSLGVATCQEEPCRSLTIDQLRVLPLT